MGYSQTLTPPFAIAPIAGIYTDLTAHSMNVPGNQMTVTMTRWFSQAAFLDPTLGDPITSFSRTITLRDPAGMIALVQKEIGLSFAAGEFPELTGAVVV